MGSIWKAKRSRYFSCMGLDKLKRIEREKSRMPVSEKVTHIIQVRVVDSCRRGLFSACFWLYHDFDYENIFTDWHIDTLIAYLESMDYRVTLFPPCGGDQRLEIYWGDPDE